MTIDTDLATLREYVAAFRFGNVNEDYDAALDRVETELARLRQENARLERGRQDFHNTVAALERELARLREGLEAVDRLLSAVPVDQLAPVTKRIVGEARAAATIALARLDNHASPHPR